MPAFIGPIAHLLPESPNRREDSLRAGHGREFSETLQSSRRQQNNGADDETGADEAPETANTVATPPVSRRQAETVSDDANAHGTSETLRSERTHSHYHNPIPGEPAQQAGDGLKDGEEVQTVEGELPPVKADTAVVGGKAEVATPPVSGSQAETVSDDANAHGTSETLRSERTHSHYHNPIPGEPAQQAGDGLKDGEEVQTVEGELPPVKADTAVVGGKAGADADPAGQAGLNTDASRAAVETPPAAAASDIQDKSAKAPSDKKSDTGEASVAPDATRADMASPGQAASAGAPAGKTQGPDANREILDAGSKPGTADSLSVAAADTAVKEPAKEAALPPTGKSAEIATSAAANEGRSTGRQTGDEGDGEPRQPTKSKSTSPALTETDIKPVTVFSGESVSNSQPSLQAASASSISAPLSAGPATIPGAPVTGAPASGPGIGAMMAPATMIAAPDDLVDIVSNKLGSGDKPDRITVQLDPPELGRVSIEFKFDAQGLQQVAVRAETADAMRQLRLMHFDLVQSLEQHGLSARDMSFSEGFAGGAGQHPDGFIDYTGSAGDEEIAAAFVPAAMPQTRAPLEIGASGLNIKL